MCHRVEAVRFDDLAQAMELRDVTGRATLPTGPGVDAYPGSLVPLLLPEADRLLPVRLAWGFASPKDGKPIFNTRLDTALDQLRSGYGLWAEAIREGRCLVPVRAFYESSRSIKRRDPATGREGQVQFRFAMPGRSVFLIAGVAQGDRFSLMTTDPNPIVSAVHTRMPLVLASGESQAWLDGDFTHLADRSFIDLTREEVSSIVQVPLKAGTVKMGTVKTGTAGRIR